MGWDNAFKNKMQKERKTRQRVSKYIEPKHLHLYNNITCKTFILTDCYRTYSSKGLPEFLW